MARGDQSRSGSVSPARKAAFQALRRIELESAFSSFLSMAPDFQRLSSRDKGFAYELVLGVLRRRATLDWMLRELRGEDPATLSPELLLILRAGLYQIVFMERVPAYAAVSEAVTLCRQVLGHKATGLVNAVLRRALRELDQWRSRLSDFPKDEALQAQIVSHPLWLWRRLVARAGLEAARAGAEAANRPPRADFRLVAPDRTAQQQVEQLVAEGEIRESHVLKGCYHGAPGPERLREFPQLACHIYFQSLASQCVPELLPVRRHDWVLDVCAAPGGKALRLAERVGKSGRVAAMDLHSHRFAHLREQMNQSGVHNVLCLVADARTRLPFRRTWGSVLVDVPCSGLGTLCRNPEIRWRIHEEELRRFHDLQLQLLSSAAEGVAAGGYLLYSTCSTEPEENEEVIGDFLSTQSGFSVAELNVPPSLRIFVRSDGFFRTFPGCPEEDGFFAALLTRVR